MSSDAGPPPDSGRERLLEAAYELFSRSGVSGVGIDTVIAKAGVAKATLYRNFGSKDNLALAFLQRREDRWTIGWLQAEVEHRATDPRARLLAIFDVFGEWFQRSDYEGCAFLTILLELDDRDSVVRQATVGHLETIRDWVAGLAADAGIEDSEGIAWQWHILMKGSIVSAAEGDMKAGARAHELAELLLAKHGV
jgi:AcrR family transcriptional regulator